MKVGMGVGVGVGTGVGVGVGVAFGSGATYTRLVGRGEADASGVVPGAGVVVTEGGSVKDGTGVSAVHPSGTGVGVAKPMPEWNWNSNHNLCRAFSNSARKYGPAKRCVFAGPDSAVTLYLSVYDSALLRISYWLAS